MASHKNPNQKFQGNKASDWSILLKEIEKLQNGVAYKFEQKI